VFDSEVSEDIKQATQRNVIYADGNEFNAALYYELAAIEAFRGGSDFEAKLAAADENAVRTNPSVEGYLTALNWAWLQQRKEEKDYGAYAVQGHLWRKAGYADWSAYYFRKFQCEMGKRPDPRYARLAQWVTRQMHTLPATTARINCDSPPTAKTDPRTQTFLANELASIGKYREAVGLLDPAIERDPNNVELLLARARYRERAGYWSRYWKEEDDAKRYYDAIARRLCQAAQAGGPESCIQTDNLLVVEFPRAVTWWSPGQ
jgi:tetratricopeptide (TPR) repeat protein